MIVPLSTKTLITLCSVTGLIVLFLVFVEYFIIGFPSRTKDAFAEREKFEHAYILHHNNQSIKAVMKSVPGYRKAVSNSAAFTTGTADYRTYVTALNWTFDPTAFRTYLFSNTTNKCKAIRERLAFFGEPLSQEERDFPLAYGFLVYDMPMQIYFLLSAIYQPQNAYCISVDSKSTDEFKQDMDLLADCFPNICVIQVNNVQWYKFSVVRGVWNCIRYLSALDHPWKYYQYLSGVDLPLKTNLEMVRIFKKLNGTVNTNIKPISNGRILRVQNQKWPIPMFKSSLSGLLSREGVDAMMASEKVRDYMIFAQQLECPDEALWATIFGNPQVLNLPGSFNGTAFYQAILAEDALKKRCTTKERIRMKLLNDITAVATPEEPFVPDSYYISRYQEWQGGDGVNPRCHGKFTHLSCVYGILDLKTLVQRPELIAHKFYWTVQPAAYFFLYETIRNRSLDPVTQSRFRGDAYGHLAHVEYARGTPLSRLRFRKSSCKMS